MLPPDMPSSQDTPDMDRTQMSTLRLGKSPAYDAPDEGSKYGYYEGRRIIGRDTPILGGVYLGDSAREAIVVDEKYGELEKAYDMMIEKVKDLKDTKKSFKAML